MPSFSIDTESILGVSHSGEVMIAGTGAVELSDEHVRSLINLIRDNGGETDVKKLQLEERFPEIYETLDEACRDAASEVAYREWLKTGYECNYFERPEGFMESIEAAGLFKFELTADQMIEKFREDYGLEENDEIDPEELDDYFEDEKEGLFYECVNKYYNSLDEDGKVAFIERFYPEAPYEWDPVNIEYNVGIPAAIIKMSENE